MSHLVKGLCTQMFAHFFSSLSNQRYCLSLCLLFSSLIVQVPSLSEKKKLQQDVYDNRCQGRHNLLVVPLPGFIPSFILSPRSSPIMERCCSLCTLVICFHQRSTWASVASLRHGPPKRNRERGPTPILKADRSLAWALEQMEVLPEGQRPLKHHVDVKMDRGLNDNSS